MDQIIYLSGLNKALISKFPDGLLIMTDTQKGLWVSWLKCVYNNQVYQHIIPYELVKILESVKPAFFKHERKIDRCANSLLHTNLIQYMDFNFHS